MGGNMRARRTVYIRNEDFTKSLTSDGGALMGAVQANVWLETAMPVAQHILCACACRRMITAALLGRAGP